MKDKINDIFTIFLEAASITRTLMRFPDVQLVLTIAMSIPTTAKPLQGQPCWPWLCSTPRDVMAALQKVSTWPSQETLSLHHSQGARQWTSIIPTRWTLLQSQPLLRMQRSRILAGKIVGRLVRVRYYFASFHRRFIKGALEGRIEQSTVTWTGEGTWMPESICYDWSKETNRVFVCTFSAGTSLSSGQSATGSCGPADGTSCP